MTTFYAALAHVCCSDYFSSIQNELTRVSRLGPSLRWGYEANEAAHGAASENGAQRLAGNLWLTRPV